MKKTLLSTCEVEKNTDWGVRLCSPVPNCQSPAPAPDRVRRGERGQVLIYALGMLGIIVVVIAVILSVATYASLGAIRSTQVSQASHLAEAGLERALEQLKADPSYVGETDTSLGDGSYSVTVTGAGATRTLTATGASADGSGPERTLRLQVIMDTSDVQFFYGVQVDDGGLEMGNNAQVVGNIFSNGDVEGNNGATLTGDVIVAGGLGDPNVSHTTQTQDQPFGDADGRRDAAVSFTPSAAGPLSRLSLYLKKVGNPGDLPVRITTDSGNNPTKTSLASATIDNDTVGTGYSWITTNFSSPPTLTAGTRYWVLLDMGKNATNYYRWGEETTATTVLGFETPTTDGDLANFPASNSGSGDPVQSFTTGDSGAEVTSVDVSLKRVGGTNPSNVYLEIRSSSPVGTVLGTSPTITSSSIPTTGLTWTSFPFTTPVTLAANTKYYARLRSIPPSTVPFSGSQSLLHWGYQQTASSPYAGGDAYRYVGRNNVPSDPGQILTQYDFGFRVLSNPADGAGRLSDNWNAGTPVWTPAFGTLNHQVWIGGIPRTLEGLIIGGDARANTIDDATITGDAYFQSIANSTVIGTQFPNSPDTDRADLPISDGAIADWKAAAAAGGTHTGDYELTNGATATLGPKKITGKLKLDNNAILTVSGTLWVEGEIDLSNNCTVRLDPGYGGNSGIILTDGKVTVNNNCQFVGSGQAGSYVLLLSAKDSILEEVMSISNNAIGVIYYAGRGIIRFSNNATAKEATAYGMRLDNNAVITYESGLSDVHFSNGPGGGWQIVPGTWQIVRP